MDLKKPARRGRGRMRLLALGGVVAVLAAGCGGSGTPAKTTSKKQTAKKTAVSKPLTTTVAASTGAATTPTSAVSTTSSVASSSSNSPAFASAGNCTQLAGVGEQFAKAMTAASSGGKYNINAVMAAYQKLANAAPAGIRPDLEVIAHALTTYVSALSKAGYTAGTAPSATQIAAIEGAAKSLSAPKLEAAAKAAEAWAVKNCSA